MSAAGHASIGNERVNVFAAIPERFQNASAVFAQGRVMGRLARRFHPQISAGGRGTVSAPCSGVLYVSSASVLICGCDLRSSRAMQGAQGTSAAIKISNASASMPCAVSENFHNVIHMHQPPAHGIKARIFEKFWIAEHRQYRIPVMVLQWCQSD